MKHLCVPDSITVKILEKNNVCAVCLFCLFLATKLNAEVISKIDAFCESLYLKRNRAEVEKSSTLS